MRSPKQSRSWPPTKAVTSPAVNSSWTAVRPRSKRICLFIDARLLFDLHHQPSARQTPVARYRLFLNFQDGSGLSHAEATEVAQLHDASFAMVRFCQ